MKEEIKKLKEAYKKYNLDNRDDLPNKILEYISERIKANKLEIEQIIDIKKIELKYEAIIDTINNELNNKIESYGKTVINKKGFMFSQILVPVGIVAVETYDPIEIIKYWLKAIKSRNAVVISSVEYDENSIEGLILIIIKEALLKFRIDENIVMYMPFEECFYEYFDKVIYTYNEKGEKEKKVRTQMKRIDKEQIKKNYVYVEDEYFREEAEKNKNAEIITGEINEVFEKIQNAMCATIYTQNSKKAFEFINLADCINVFVNTNVENAINTLESEDELYKYRNIIVPVPKELLSKERVNDNTEKKESEFENNKDEQKNKEMTGLIKYKESLWEKIKRRLKL